MLTFEIVKYNSDSKLFSSKIIRNRGDDSFRLLIDIGATIPVWVAGHAAFNRTFPGAVLLNKTIYLFGFGGTSEKDTIEECKLYKVPWFCLSDGWEHEPYLRDIEEQTIEKKTKTIVIKIRKEHNNVFSRRNFHTKLPGYTGARRFGRGLRSSSSLGGRYAGAYYKEILHSQPL